MTVNYCSILTLEIIGFSYHYKTFYDRNNFQSVVATMFVYVGHLSPSLIFAC
jgi:hypothetical protein